MTAVLYGGAPMRPWEVGDPPTVQPVTAPAAGAPRLDPAKIAEAFGAPKRVRVAMRKEGGKTFLRLESAGKLLAEVVIDGDSAVLELDL